MSPPIPATTPHRLYCTGWLFGVTRRMSRPFNLRYFGSGNRDYFDDAVGGRFVAVGPDATRDLVLCPRGYVADGRVVDRVAAVHTTFHDDPMLTAP